MVEEQKTSVARTMLTQKTTTPGEAAGALEKERYAQSCLIWLTDRRENRLPVRAGIKLVASEPKATG